MAVEGNPKEEQKQEKQLFYFGMEINNSPYTGLSNDTQAVGLLITSVSQLCEKIKIKCEFVSNSFSKMLGDIQLDKLDALVIVRQLILPKTDKLKLTIPLCKIQPVFIHSTDFSKSINIEDLAGTTIGVKEGSRLHFYLIQKYRPEVIIKPYSLLESGLFDLLTNRIDRLATDKAFASTHLAKMFFAEKRYIATSLSTKNNEKEDKDKDKDKDKNNSNKMLNILNDVSFLSTQMTLALRDDDIQLYEKLTRAIQARGQVPYCSDLLP
jgi:hypothetical protein